MIPLRDYQQRAIDQLRQAIREGFRAPCMVAPTGAGKCLGKDTPVLMFDGSIKAVQDIIVGDVLMGPDSSPRNVLSTTTGREMLYKITPNKGDPYIVNASHILSLKSTNFSGRCSLGDGHFASGDIVNVDIRTYLNGSKTAKHLLKGWRPERIDFKPAGDLKIPPYVLGIWLGDGTERESSLTKYPGAVVDAWNKWGADNKCYSSVSDKKRCPTWRLSSRGNNECMAALRELNLIGNKHVPDTYKTASYEDRLELLAGLIDTDGSISKTGYDFIQKRKHISDAVAFLCRSVGLSAYITECRKKIKSIGFEGTYYRVSISGNTNKIPCRVKKTGERKQKKSDLVHGIDVSEVGDGDYYGFEIDGDNLFLLGDFTVTHNTRISASIAASTVSNGKRLLFIAPRRNLVEQTCKSFRELGIDSGMIMAGVPFEPWHKVEIASVDTIMARLDNPTSNGTVSLYAADVVIFDEGHTYASPERAKLINALREGAYGPRKIVMLLTATPCVTGGGGLGNISDRLVIPVTMPELIEAGALLQPRYYSAERPDLSGVKMMGDDYNSKQLGAAYDGKIMGCVVDNWLRIAPGTSTVVFTATRANAMDVVEKFSSKGIPSAYMDANTPDEERFMIFDGLASGRILVVANVGIISLGSDIPRLQTVSFATATRSISRWMQGVGRVLRPYEDQQWSNVIDHGGMSLDPRMGPVEFINDWSLDEKTTVQERIERSKQEKKEPIDVQCSNCARVYKAAHACPFCGHQRKAKGEALEYHEAKLEQVDTTKASAAERRNRATPAEDKRRFYGELLGYVASKGQQEGRAKHLYREYFSVWPNAHSGVPPLPPSPETISYIKSRDIRNAKSRKSA